MSVKNSPAPSRSQHRFFGIPPTIFAWFFILSAGVAASFIPAITWNHNHPQLHPSLYEHVSWAARIPAIFNRWDVLRYTHIAMQGYTPNDPAYLAFFPGWPLLLRLMAKLSALNEASLGIAAIGVNLFLWTASLGVWRRVLEKTPAFAEHPVWKEGGRRLFPWLFAFYPTTLFNVVGYAESCFLLLAGLCLLAIQEERGKSLLLFFPLLMSLKHIGIAVGVALLLWVLLFRARLRLFAAIGTALGLLFVLGFYQITAGDPLVWVKIQSAWGRHWSLPLAVLLDAQGKAFELNLYAIYLFLGPALLAWLVWKKGRWASLNLLMLFYLGAVLAPVWFGGSIQSIYRILYLVPFLIALPTLYLAKARPWLRASALGLCAIMNIHATYRYVAGLFIN